jgi:N-acyl-D-aspartate/D-glutamate deacylase
MTSLPTGKLGIRDRGLVEPGHWADLVVFDPDDIADTATYIDPYRYPKGIWHLVVNDIPVIKDGEHTGALPGRALRHRA